MNIEDYCNINDNLLRFSRKQASTFAKEVAGDFNPIHDIMAKRFCVPGDLLFAILLSRYGVASHTQVEFMGMVGDGVSIQLPEEVNESYRLQDHREKEYLELTYEGTRWNDATMVANFIRKYVQFSGMTFPDVLVGLMRDEGVMINPQRPLVIYKSMSVDLEQPLPDNFNLKLEKATLEVEGKKGQTDLFFVLEVDGDLIGRGKKEMVLSGLRDYDEDAMTAIVQEYAERKTTYSPGTG